MIMKRHREEWQWSSGYCQSCAKIMRIWETFCTLVLNSHFRLVWRTFCMIYLKLNFSSLFFHRLLRYYLFLIIVSITRLQALISFLLLLLLISILHFRNGFYWAWVETNDNYVYIFTSHMSLNIDVVCMFWESRGKQWLYVHKYVNVVDFIETSVHCNIHTYTSAYSPTYASIWNYTYMCLFPLVSLCLFTLSLSK